jgi:hypothetical protein
MLPFTISYTYTLNPARRAALFMHIQKTAGTTIIEAVRRHYRNDMVSHGEYLDRDAASLTKTAFISGHFGFEYSRQFMEGRYSFTFLRDPVERVLSLYFFSRSRDPAEFPIYRAAHEMDLVEYLRAGFDRADIREYVWNHQAWQLACGWNDPQQRQMTDFTGEELLERAKANLLKFDYVGLAETFADDSKAILANLSVPAPQKLVPANVTPQRPHRNDVPAAALRLAEELTTLDAALYAHAKALRSQDLSTP